MLDPALVMVPPRDLPVCFPGRPCLDYPPSVAGLISSTTLMTPASQQIAIGCFVLLAIGVAVTAIGLRPRSSRPGPSLWLVVLTIGLIVIGAVTDAAVQTRLDAVSLIYGPEGAPSADLIGSWPLVGLASEALTSVGVLALAVTATVAIVRLRRAGGH